MPFDTFTPRQKIVAESALAFCRAQYGGNGLKVESEIAPTISWRPSFYLKPTKALILAVEVDENLYPEALKGAAHDIGHYEFPIAVYQACSLDVYLTDPGQAKVKMLKRRGFGIITVDDSGNAEIQHTTIPLAQHISPDQLESEMADLSAVLRPRFKAAYRSYETNEGQGLQQAAQIVEGLVHSITVQAAKRQLVAAAAPKMALADMIDVLYENKKFKDHRAALGAARGFVKAFRNTASHAPHNAKEAGEKIKKCRAGFLDAIDVANGLHRVIRAFRYKVKLYTT